MPALVVHKGPVCRVGTEKKIQILEKIEGLPRSNSWNKYGFIFW